MTAILELGRMPQRRTMAVCALLAALVALAGCAAIRPAEMALPAPLTGIEPEPVQGMGTGRSGNFTLARSQGSYQRAADRLALFDNVTFDRATIRYRWQREDGSAVQAACRGRQTTVTLGMLQGQARPYTLECQWTGALLAAMTVTAQSGSRGLRDDRNGVFSVDRTTLALQSVHQVQGSPLPLNAPIGYVITHNGAPVGAVELNGTTPRLWRPLPGHALREPVTLAALALALLWDTPG